MKVRLINADVLTGLAMLPDESVDSCLCDPPYELGFMGKKWDSSGISYSVEMWREVYRVLKPGAHLLAFGGSRTYHRLACAIEDAGFEVRDQIMWLYGSGFPKSLDVSKAIDKTAGAEAATRGTPSTPLAQQWDGWGTALKPAHEPIVVARKPLEGTVVQNVLKHGTGAINVAGCRIDTFAEGEFEKLRARADTPRQDFTGGRLHSGAEYTPKLIDSSMSADGRWPANVIHDGSPEVLACFPDSDHARGNKGASKGGGGLYGHGPTTNDFGGGDTGSAARFFYCAKASQKERNRGLETRKASQRDESRKEGNPGGDNPRNRGVKPVKNNHPTVKPLSLMCYLVRLVTPSGGLVLDPFMGSGSTLIAAAKEGFNAVGIDREVAYVEMSRKRIAGEMGMLVEVQNDPAS
jgi:DNA modification methylase